MGFGLRGLFIVAFPWWIEWWFCFVWSFLVTVVWCVFWVVCKFLDLILYELKLTKIALYSSVVGNLVIKSRLQNIKSRFLKTEEYEKFVKFGKNLNKIPGI